MLLPRAVQDHLVFGESSRVVLGANLQFAAAYEYKLTKGMTVVFGVEVLFKFKKMHVCDPCDRNGVIQFF